MPRRPSVRIRQTPRGWAYIEAHGTRHHLGAKAGTPEAEEAARRFRAEYQANGGAPPRATDAAADDGITTIELVARYTRHAETYYRTPDGRVSREIGNIKSSLQPVLDLYGHTPAQDFDQLRLEAVREVMIEKGWSRGYVNQCVNRIRRAFKWAAGKKIVGADVYHALQTVDGLKRGRSAARETAPVKPVRQEHIDRVKGHVSKQVAALIDLQLLTAARPGELLPMRACDIDRSGKVWCYRPATHKTQHYGHHRAIWLGPKAQRILRPFLRGRSPAAPIFSPREAEGERREKLHEERKTPLSCGNVPGSNRRRKPKRRPGATYTTVSYARAIAEACKATGAPHWHPHRLRHTAATRIRKEYGLEAARAVLGHRSVEMSSHYAETDSARAVQAMAEIG